MYGVSRVSVINMVPKTVLWWVLGGLFCVQVWGFAVPHQSDGLPLALVSELTSHLGAHPARLQEARLSPLPALQDLETIKKVADILVMLGQQVIPGIIGEPQTSASPFEPVQAVGAMPNDSVTLYKQPVSS